MAASTAFSETPTNFRKALRLLVFVNFYCFGLVLGVNGNLVRSRREG